MKKTIYDYKKTLGLIGGITLIVGLIMTYFYWSIEPQESIGGFLCGLSVSMIFFSFSLKKPIKK